MAERSHQKLAETAKDSETKFRARPGRPVVLSIEQRRAQILKCAETEFFKNGYVNTRMDQIAVQAGMSKKTLYQVFSNKEEVLAAFLRGYEEDPPLSPLPPKGTYDPVAEYEKALVEVAQYILGPRQIAVSRLVIAEARQSPEVAAQFYAAEVTQVRKMLAKRIEHLQSDGILAGRKASVVADFSLSAVLGHEHFGRLIGTDLRLSDNHATLSERAAEIAALYCPTDGALDQS
ncbi:MAG: AcrR family transcriptional regulator [Celeribacter sp.]|jgi:AcrR family transcriptional regulator